MPITVENGLIVAEQVSQTGTGLSGSLTLSNIPELQAGTYYLAIVNTVQAATTYTIQAVTEGESTGRPLLTLLENGSFAGGSAPAGPFLASRQFAVDIPTWAWARFAWTWMVIRMSISMSASPPRST